LTFLSAMPFFLSPPTGQLVDAMARLLAYFLFLRNF